MKCTFVSSAFVAGHLKRSSDQTSQPSPSLGPPLLSASWSPPLFCGIVHIVVGGAVVGGGGGWVVAGRGDVVAGAVWVVGGAGVAVVAGATAGELTAVVGAAFRTVEGAVVPVDPPPTVAAGPAAGAVLVAAEPFGLAPDPV